MSNKSFYKINHFIQAPQLRIIDETGKMLGVLTKDEALKKAQELELDLVEIASSAKPPVAKIIDFSKFKYQMSQKKQEEKKKNKAAETKEIRFTPFIAGNDFDIRVKKATEYLRSGDKVRLVVKFTGREITRKNFGDAILARATKALEDISKIEITPRLVGKNMFLQLVPHKKKKVQDEDNNNEENYENENQDQNS